SPLGEDQRTGPGELGLATAVADGSRGIRPAFPRAVVPAGVAARAVGRAAVAVAAAGGMQAGLEDHREPGPATARYPDDVTRTQLREGSRRLSPPGARPGAGQVTLAFGQRPPQLRVLGEVTLLAA